MVAAHQVEQIVSAVRQPPVDEPIIEPRPPPALQRHAYINLGDGRGYACCKEWKINQ
jgi:hypothetical protein